MQDSIAQSTLTEYLRFSSRDARADFIRGQKDGEGMYPPSEQKEYSTHEERLIEEGNAALNKYTRRLREVRDSLHGEISSKKSERDDKYASEKDALINRKEMEIALLQESSGEDSPAGIRLREKVTEAREAYHQLEMDLGRPPLLKFHQPIFWFVSVYMIVLTILAILEAPINYLAIEVFFRNSPVFSAVTALFVGVLFVSFAHIFGILIRQIPSYGSSVKRFFGWLSALGILALAISLMAVLFLMREQAGIALGSETPRDAVSSFVDSVMPQQSEDIFAMSRQEAERRQQEATVKGTPDYPKWGMLILNIAVFFVATAISIVRHDPHPDYETLLRSKEETEDKLEKFRTNFILKRSAIHEKYEKRINETETWSDVVDSEIGQLAEKLENLRAQAGFDYEVVLSVIRMRMLAYQDGNHQTRDGADPRYFGAAGLADLKKRLEMPS